MLYCCVRVCIRQKRTEQRTTRGRSLFFLSHHPRTIRALVQWRHGKFIGGKFKTSTLPYMLALKIHDDFLLPRCDIGQVIIFFLVWMVFNFGQDTFIDYLSKECGLAQVTSLMIFFSFNVVQPWASHFYCIPVSYCLLLECGLGQITSLFSCCAALDKTLLIDYHGGVAFTSLMIFFEGQWSRSMWIVFVYLCRPPVSSTNSMTSCTSARVQRGWCDIKWQPFAAWWALLKTCLNLLIIIYAGHR
jgi:hypothetical protein